MTRRKADAATIGQLMEALPRRVSKPATVFLTGGATAVLHGWRATTDDVDLKVEAADEDAVMRALVALRDELGINVEFATPDHFIPVRAGWRDRSPFIRTAGAITFRHFEYLAQALSKTSRWVAHDQDDVRAMLQRGLVTPGDAWACFRAIGPDFYRFPTLRAAPFEARMREAFGPEPGE